MCQLIGTSKIAEVLRQAAEEHLKSESWLWVVETYSVDKNGQDIKINSKERSGSVQYFIIIYFNFTIIKQNKTSIL